jgi:hypothetical protein
MHQLNKSSAKFSIICSDAFAILFLIGSFNGIQYGYYQFLRVILFISLPMCILSYCISFDFTGIFTYEDFKSFPVFVDIVTFILFNPIAPFAFSRNVWMGIDIACTIVQAIIAFYIAVKHFAE